MCSVISHTRSYSSPDSPLPAHYVDSSRWTVLSAHVHTHTTLSTHIIVVRIDSRRYALVHFSVDSIFNSSTMSYSIFLERIHLALLKLYTYCWPSTLLSSLFHVRVKLNSSQNWWPWVWISSLRSLRYCIKLCFLACLVLKETDKVKSKNNLSIAFVIGKEKNQSCG